MCVMDKYLKMADVFEGGVVANHGGDFNGWSVIETPLGRSIDESGDGGFTQRTADYVSHAINSHDELAAEVKRLRYENSILRTRLENSERLNSELLIEQ